MHGFHHDGGPRGHGLPPMFAMAGRMPGFAAAAGGRARRGDIRTAILRLLAELVPRSGNDPLPTP